MIKNSELSRAARLLNEFLMLQLGEKNSNISCIVDVVETGEIVFRKMSGIMTRT